MQRFKSAIVAILKRCQFGTFEPLHGIQNFFRLNNFFLGPMKKSLHDFVQKVSQSQPNPRFTQIQRENPDFLTFPPSFIMLGPMNKELEMCFVLGVYSQFCPVCFLYLAMKLRGSCPSTDKKNRVSLD